LDFLHETHFFTPKQAKCIAKGSEIFLKQPPPLFIGKREVLAAQRLLEEDF